MHTPEELISLYEEKFGVNNFHNTPSGLYSPVNHIMNMKGKRIRPLLLMNGCELFGGNVEVALNPAFAMEIFHNFTLVHDDIMDNADVRRGEPTVHKLYGLNAGILAGDVMLSYAYKYLTDVPSAFVSLLLNAFNKTAIEIFEGQQMDMDFEKRLDVTEDEYLKMIEFKTSVLLGCCLQLGAIVAGASIENQAMVYEFGRLLGLSFQVKDDYLDAFGEEQKVGKKIGGDILQNKKTHLFVSVWNKSNEEQKEQLNALVNEKNAAKKIEGVKALYEITGARRYTLDKANQLYLQALKSLEKIKVNDEKKKPLSVLAQKINEREF